jgi:acyl-coenzyme A thioesterase PaaI-like protein
MLAMMETTDPAAKIEEAEKGLSALVSSHPAAKKARASVVTGESRRVYRLDDAGTACNLMTSALSGADKIPAPPYVFVDDTKGTLLAFYHLGGSLCGNPGIIHGGLIAALLDEVMGRACLGLMPHKVAVTATLDLMYLSPVPADAVCMAQVETERQEGNMAWVHGWLENLDTGKKLAEARGLFIQPKDAAKMPQMM